jgi:pyruvate,orthophosphate dikinase
MLKRVEELRVQSHARAPRLRLGITYPEITEMQARAIFEAACDVAQKGGR